MYCKSVWMSSFCSLVTLQFDPCIQLAVESILLCLFDIFKMCFSPRGHSSSLLVPLCVPSALYSFIQGKSTICRNVIQLFILNTGIL